MTKEHQCAIEYVMASTSNAVKHRLPGLPGMVEKLITTGKCITTIESTTVWCGGFGNCVSSKEYTGGVDLYEWTLANCFFRAIDYHAFKERKLEKLLDAERSIQQEIREMHKITTG